MNESIDRAEMISNLIKLRKQNEAALTSLSFDCFRKNLKIYPNQVIRRHDRIKLNGLELDFYLPELRLAFEYDGEQHFDKELYEKVYGEGFDEQVRRDRLKDKLCRKKGIKLIRVKFDESITKRHLTQRGIVNV